MSETPNIHLALGADADTNRNWEILDSTIKSLGLRQIIPDNVLVQGNLEVTGDALIDGTLTANAVVAQNALSAHGTLDVTGLATFHNGTAFNAGSIDGAVLIPGTVVQTAASSTPLTGTTLLTPTLTEIHKLTLDATETVNRWSLVFVQATLTIIGSNAGYSATVTLDLRRGGVAQQSRTFAYTNVPTNPPPAHDVPVTLIRVTKITDVTAHDWSLWANAVITTGTPQVPPSITFAQIHALQLR